MKHHTKFFKRGARLPHGSGRQAGFALPAALIALLLLSGLSLQVVIQSRQSTIGRIEQKRIRDEILLESAIARNAIALLSKADPILSDLRRGGKVDWSFEDRIVSLEMTVESGKIDLNQADRALTNRVLKSVFGEKALSLAPPGEVKAPDEFLRIEERFGRLSYLARRYFTVMSGQARLSPAASTPDLRELLARTGDDNIGGSAEQAIYTLGACLKESGACVQSIVMIVDDPRKIVVLDRWKGNAGLDQ